MEQKGEKKVKNLKDIKSVDEFNDEMISAKLICGETPFDIEEKCLELCSHYLSGNWNLQTVDTIEVRRVSGGIINQLYYCGIKEPDHSESVPQEVAVRLYGNNPYEWSGGSKIIRDAVITMFLENKHGPKVYGLFETGQILKWYKHRTFSRDEHKNIKIVEQVMRKLARIHSLNVPIKRNQKWMFELMFKFYEEMFQKFPIKQEMDENNCELLKTFDFKSQMNWIIGIAERANSPIVFAHNDYCSTNIMITEPNDDLVVCDFDLTAYGYRGYDLVKLINELAPNPKEVTSVEIPFAEDSVFIPLLEIYVNECQKIYGQSFSVNEINSIEHILKEVKIFLLFARLFAVIDLMRNDEKEGYPMNRKLCMELAEVYLKKYLYLKKILQEQNLI